MIYSKIIPTEKCSKIDRYEAKMDNTWFIGQQVQIVVFIKFLNVTSYQN